MGVSIEERNKIVISIVNIEAKRGAQPTDVMGNVDFFSQFAMFGLSNCGIYILART